MPRLLPWHWLAMSGAAAAAQLVAGFARPADGLVTVAGLTAQCLIGGAYALTRAGEGKLYSYWIMLAIGFACWASGYVAVGGEELMIGPHGGFGLLDDALALLKAAPFIVLFTAGFEYRPVSRLLRTDLTGVLIFMAIAAVLMIGDPFAGRTPDDNTLIYRQVENGVLALLAVITLTAQRRAADRALYRQIAWLLVGYAATAAVVNGFLIGRLPAAPGSPWLAVAALPFVLFHAAAVVPLAASRRRSWLSRPVRRLGPALMSSISLLMTFAIAERGDPSGLVLGMALVAYYAWRTTIAQWEASSVNASLRRSRRRLETLAATDPLTGVANRRQFDRALAHDWAVAERDDSHIAVIFVDVDWFKNLNDAFGHAAGDACLQKLARVLDAATGNNGCFARVGGEEFGVVARRAPLDALAMGEALRRSVDDLAINHPGSPLAKVTVSVGVGTARPGHDGSTVAALMLAADTALYAAKSDGRNRVVARATTERERPATASPPAVA